MADQLPLGFEAPKRRRRGALRSFHVRSHTRAEDAARGEARAKGQEESILSWIRAQGPGLRFTPTDVKRAFPGLELTSIRRALTNLATARESRPARLVHHPEDLRESPRGGTESTWAAVPWPCRLCEDDDPRSHTCPDGTRVSRVG